MPGDAVVAAPAEAGGPAPAGRQGGMGGLVSMVARMVFMWWLMSWFKGDKTKTASKEPQLYSSPKFIKGQLVDMYVFLTEQDVVPDGRFNMADLVWSETGIRLAEADARNVSINYEPSPAVQHNGSVFIHAVFAKAGATINPDASDFNEDVVFGRPFNLITYLPRRKNTTGVKLLSGVQPLEKVVKKEEGPREIISFIRPNLTIQAVDHFQVYPKNAVPAQIASWMQYDQMGNHYPIVFFNDFWLLKDYLVPMNDTVSNITIHLDLGFISLTWWQLLSQMEKTFESQRGMGLQQDGESDELKRVFIEGNPILLGITMIVSLLHTVFDMLAFKNDIGFWKNNKSMEGLSARSVLINAFCQLVILLYLLDNETSYVVLFSSFLGCGIEFWKVTKAMKVTMVPNFPFIKLEDRQSYSLSMTKQYDKEASQYLSYALYPLVLGYAIYSLMYKSHKSWYSWILNSLVGAVYMFGFILLCPQLYLNYKLKSVAHLPWRQMTYKFLNTIIDDLFAFVIKMPLLHRLSVFRDDLVFLVYIYQRWIYRVDLKRVNEFGYSGVPDETAEPAAIEADVQAPAVEGTAEAAGTKSAAKSGKGKRKDAKAPGPAEADAGAGSQAAGDEDKKAT
mmetsp:Transcript_13857/g.24278  ORF Transcript_13857/g.24278 Transcript_13857/m.24278 type:complete len:620 (+) Transcript_13857:140-1999(+)|eukprot:CAMPEP_0119112590 /NCGR_PEP_ID=MMETSP1180-20130426/40905_1 /TAXON_ID=3052 ORGANISM="Chlamydomonas cf sp, Strain CCMP681" /NCGR_SAMPLE_ID=MMETSP1180 /ASSEMBLY_ACC=CAM_ASM_000741 /LENGTH=619 /DNA_ID=CAMNT_0007100167 /DNA_START=73 /DNA_END=1932 /DNA_ORIENTATION=+